jgi:chemotaxis methyl-accepting protein methylase
MVRSNTFVAGRAGSRLFQRFLDAYLYQVIRIWNHFPPSLQVRSPGLLYGRHLHMLVRLQADRQQYFATFFLRNRPELELIRRLADKKAQGATLNISILACSKGAEVYSILWTIRSARPDLKVRMHAVDISQEIVEFAERGIYSLDPAGTEEQAGQSGNASDVIRNTARDQSAPMFERMTKEELEAMCEVEGGMAKVRSWLKEGIVWLRGDAGNPDVVDALGPQDIVVANRFLCHMEPADAERCLRNIARLVKPGGHLFVSGVDLDVRTKVARGLGWKPVPDLMREIHEGDTSLRSGWPLGYWGLEPFLPGRSDWRVRYSSVFQIGETS